MERYNIGFDGVHASESCKRRMKNVLMEMNATPTASASAKTSSLRMPKRRKALLICIAAILLLLSACAAYAIYWSSTQRAKDNATALLEQPVDELQQVAEDAADAYLAAVTLTAPLSGSATVGDVTIAMDSVEVFQDADGAEYVFHYTVQSGSVGFVTSFSEDYMDSDLDAQARFGQYETFCELGIDARDFVLTIDGQAFTPYYPPDYEGTPQPASSWNAPDDTRAWTSSFMLRANPFPITQSSRMRLSGTLYACDREGKRIGELGFFSIDFDYRYPVEQAEEARQKFIAEFKQSQQAVNAARLDALNALPEQSVHVGCPFGIAMLTDITFLDDGLLLGFFEDQSNRPSDAVPRQINAPLDYYLDGYRQHAEVIDMSFELDTTKPKDDMGSYPAKSHSSIYKLPYYRPAAEMPETVTVCILENEAERARVLASGNKDFDTEPFSLILRVNRVAGTVTLPGDDAEKAQWLAEHRALLSDGRSADRAYKLSKNARQTIGDVTLWIPEIDYEPGAGVIQLCYWFKNLTCDIMVWETTPTVRIDGLPLDRHRGDAFYHKGETQPPKPFQVNIPEWTSTYDVTKKRDFWECDAFSIPVRITELPETFTLDVTWDIYDLNAQAERVYVGQFHITEEIRRDGYQVYDAYDSNRIWSKEVSW